MEDEGLGTHLWVGNHSRRLEVGAKPLVLFRCPLCERDFARAPADSKWRAVRVSTFRVGLTRLVISGFPNRVRGPRQKDYR
jgi:hypothetical protein